MLFDTHAHYEDARFDEDREAVLSSLHDAGVGLVMNVGSDMQTSVKSVTLAHLYDWIYAAVGTHPHEADTWVAPDGEIYRQLCMDPKVRAIGEIGLDYHYDLSPRDVQKEVFEKQLQMAAELQKPVIIHSREACEDTMVLVRKYAPSVTGVFHCYSYALETAKELVRLGWYLSFTGAITFKNAKKALEVVEWAPLSRIFVETDSPYMTPEPYRGQRNDSAKIRLVAEKIAAIKNMSPETVEEETRKNGMAFFGIPE